MRVKNIVKISLEFRLENIGNKCYILKINNIWGIYFSGLLKLC